MEAINWIKAYEKLPENNNKHILIESYCHKNNVTHFGCGYFKDDHFHGCAWESMFPTGYDFEVKQWAEMDDN